jgi:general secretion pathway protein G
MKKTMSGFTIVELLVVIVVIAILAAITIVAYNGIQTRAENTKTISAASQWAKALQMYKIDNGSYPTMNSCLGSSTTYTSSGGGRCWSGPTNGTWLVQASFLTALDPYIKRLPEPSQSNVNIDTDQRRGAIYYRLAAGDERIYIANIGTGACPDISGLGASFSSTTYGLGKECQYKLPQ